MSGGSQQLRLFRRAIRDGATLDEACEAAGRLSNGDLIISLAEGRIHLERDAKNPPPPEAYELLYDPDAVAAASEQKEPVMAAAAKQEPQNGGEYKRPDAAKAFDIYDKQIKPKLTKIDTARGELSQPWQDIKEHAHFPRPVMNFLISLENIEDEAKRDHYLLALSDGLRHRKLFLPRDLVTMSDGTDGAEIVQMADRKKPQLATLAGDPDLEMGVPSDGEETDLAEAGEDDEPDTQIEGDGIGEALPPADDEFTEATEEELAAQRDRPGHSDDEEAEIAEAAE